MERLSENKDKYYFLLKNQIFYSDIKYKYKLSLKGDKINLSGCQIRIKNFFEIFLFVDENTYHSITTIFINLTNVLLCVV
jgi:hypothetical protein